MAVEIPVETLESKPKKEKSSMKRKSTEAESSEVKSKTKKEKSSKKVKVDTDALPNEATEAIEVEESKQSKEKRKSSPAVEDESTEPPSKKRKASVEEIEVDITAPEPPSKKALRALKKGKPLPPSKSGAETKPETEVKKPEQEKRSEHGVWIGNLSWSTSKDDLRKFLVEFSDLTDEMITRIHMPGPNDTKSANHVAPVNSNFVKVQHNKGFAYVDFSTGKGTKLAIELSEQLLTGRRLLIKDSKSYEGRPMKSETSNNGRPPNKKIFLGNLNYDVNEEILTEFFGKCGAIASVKVAQFEDSGKCKGYGWLEFEELESAQNAVRGFIMVKAEENSDDESQSEVDSEDEDRKSKPKKTKMRKFWLNKLKGRPMKVEFAENAQVRYKKRYGKDGSKNSGDASADGVKEARESSKAVAKPIKYDTPHGSARLTGGIVESTGKKIALS